MIGRAALDRLAKLESAAKSRFNNNLFIPQGDWDADYREAWGRYIDHIMAQPEPYFHLINNTHFCPRLLVKPEFEHMIAKDTTLKQISEFYKIMISR